MTRPYKIALSATVLICVAMVAYYMDRSSTDRATGATPVDPAIGTVASVAGAPDGDAADGSSGSHSPQIVRLLKEIQNRVPAEETNPKPLTPRPKTQDPAPEPPTLTLGSKEVKPLFPTVNGRTASEWEMIDRLRANVSGGRSRVGSDLAAVGADPVYTDYTIRSGDTFSSIAVTMYGSERYWVDIAQANPNTSPTRLDVGDVIRLPAQGRLQRGGRPSVVRGQPVTYTVRPGDSLYTIAGEIYNAPNLWSTIYDANRKKIGRDPAALEAGMALVIPAAPKQ